MDTSVKVDGQADLAHRLFATQYTVGALRYIQVMRDVSTILTMYLQYSVKKKVQSTQYLRQQSHFWPLSANDRLGAYSKISQGCKD